MQWSGVSPGRATVRTNVFGGGNAEATAIIGKKAEFTEKKSMPAYVKFNGDYLAGGTPGIIAGSMYNKVYVSVHDLTKHTELTGITVYENSSEVDYFQSSKGKVNHSLLVYLKPSHTYIFKLGVESNTSCYGPSVVDNDGQVNLNSIDINFIE